MNQMAGGLVFMQTMAPSTLARVAPFQVSRLWFCWTRSLKPLGNQHQAQMVMLYSVRVTRETAFCDADRKRALNYGARAGKNGYQLTRRRAPITIRLGQGVPSVSKRYWRQIVNPLIDKEYFILKNRKENNARRGFYPWCRLMIYVVAIVASWQR